MYSQLVRYIGALIVRILYEYAETVNADEYINDRMFDIDIV